MNKLQRKLLEVYGGGDYAHLISHMEGLTGQRKKQDKLIEKSAYDTLLLFLWRELGDDGYTSTEEYLGRLERAKEDIDSVMRAIERMPDVQSVAQVQFTGAAG